MTKHEVGSRIRNLVVRGALALALATLVCLLVLRRSSMTVRDHATSTRPDTLHVLFIGNSHTFVNDLPGVFEKLIRAKHPGRGLAITEVTMGGATLADHLEDGAAARTIARSPRDYVVLQERSLTPIYAPDAFENSVRRFDALVKAAHAKTVIYELWPHRDATSSDEDVYARVARAVGAILVRVGPAWVHALARDPNLPLYAPDGYHPAPAGTYLAACVFYATLLGETVDDLPTLDMVTPEVAAKLHRAAALQ
ncbi:MAG TPA: hypothetical protein VGH87_24670 [Polyangiaceae bacterium]|jgi:hypothetical protein